MSALYYHTIITTVLHKVKKLQLPTTSFSQPLFSPKVPPPSNFEKSYQKWVFNLRRRRDINISCKEKRLDPLTPRKSEMVFYTVHRFVTTADQNILGILQITVII